MVDATFFVASGDAAELPEAVALLAALPGPAEVLTDTYGATDLTPDTLPRIGLVHGAQSRTQPGTLNGHRLNGSFGETRLQARDD